MSDSGSRENRLWRTLHPRTIAVVGASKDPGKRGHQVLQALRNRGFPGRVIPVNPKGGAILGMPVAPSLTDIPHTIDLAAIATPAHKVPEALEDCGTHGVKGAVVLAAGFRELGGQGERLERRIRNIARAHDVRLIGPNTSGLMNLNAHVDLIGLPHAHPGPLALLAQSGNLALCTVNAAADHPGAGLSTVVGVGNETEVEFHEYLSVLGADPEVRAILLHAESFSNGRAFVDATREVSMRKPVVALKGGRSRAGEAAAHSHTGAVTTNHSTVQAAFRRAGIIEVTRLDDLLPVGRTLESQPAADPESGFVVLADGGGQGTLAADFLHERQVRLAQLSEKSREGLRDLLGPNATLNNPVDVAGAADRDPRVFGEAMQILMADPAVSGVLLISLFGGYAHRFSIHLESAEHEAAHQMIRAAEEAHKPLVVHSVYAHSGGKPVQALLHARVPVLRSVETACRAATATWERGLFLKRMERQGEDSSTPSRNGTLRANGRPCVRRARSEGRKALLETEARELLIQYGIPVVPGRLCTNEAEVAEAAEALASRVALKAVSGTVTHKTDAQGVQLGLEGPEQARQAFRDIRAAVERYARKMGLRPDLRGVLVCPMLCEPEIELLAGARRDPVFGPTLTVGAGGTRVEVLNDVAHAMTPVGRDDISDMLERLRIAPLLNGYRGSAGVARRPLTDLLLGLAQLIEVETEIDEIEVNPVFAGPDRVCAVDARAYIADPGVA